MDIFSSEKQLIKNRIEELKRSKENAGMNRNIVIAAGDTILKEDAEEYKALKRMAEILEFDNRQASRWEYLEEREKTKLVPLDPSIKDIFQNPVPLRDRELRIVEGEIQGIAKTPARATAIALDKMSVPKDELDRYNALLRMRDIINQKFKTDNYYEYMELREEVGLGKLSDKEYLILLGRSNSSKKDYSRYMDDSALVRGRIDKSASEERMTSSKPSNATHSKEDASLPLPNENIIYRESDPLKSDLARQMSQRNSSLIASAPQMERSSRDLPIARGESKLATAGGLVESEYAYDQGFDINWGPKVLPGEVASTTQPQISDGLEDYERDAIEVEWRLIDEPEDEKQTDTQTPVYDSTLKHSGNVDIQQTQGSRDVRPESKPAEEEEELFEVEKVTPWQWVKDHKKQILIALGLSALSISVIVAITQLLPALVAASEASQVAGIASEMLRNGMLHHTAIASEKLALHGANTALANLVTSLTGLSNSFSTATGVWTLGAETLPEFVVSSAAKATLAADKVAKLTTIANVAGLGGIGALGAGLLVPKKKSAEYKVIKESIDNLIASQSENDQTREAQLISNKIIASSKLSDSEKSILFKKLQRALKKMKKGNIKVTNSAGNYGANPLYDNDNENEKGKGL